MRYRRQIASITYWIMRLGVIMYLLSLLWDIGLTNDGKGASSAIFVIAVIFIIVLVFVILIVDRSNFNVLGFSLVLISSVIKIFMSLNMTGLTSDILAYVLLIAVSIYFITKEERNRKKRRIPNF